MRNGPGCSGKNGARRPRSATSRPCAPHLRGEEGEIGRRIVEERPRACRRQSRTERRAELDGIAAGQQLERRNHGEEDADEEPAHLLHRMEVEVVRLMQRLRRREVGGRRRRQHHEGAGADAEVVRRRPSSRAAGTPRRAPRRGARDCAVRGRSIASGLLLADPPGAGARRKFLTSSMKNTASSSAHAQQPRRPAVLQHPPERHAAQETEEQRRIADRRQAAAGIAHDEDEQHDVKAGDAISCSCGSTGGSAAWTRPWCR